jgi:hypothetical protein
VQGGVPECRSGSSRAFATSSAESRWSAGASVVLTVKLTVSSVISVPGIRTYPLNLAPSGKSVPAFSWVWVWVWLGGWVRARPGAGFSSAAPFSAARAGPPVSSAVPAAAVPAAAAPVYPSSVRLERLDMIPVRLS